MGQIAFLTSRQLSANEQDYMTSPEWQSYPLLPYPSHLSDGSLATDPWPGFDLHPIRSTPEGSPIGGLVERGGAWGCRETKRSQSKGSLLCIEFPAPCWQKMFIQKHARSFYWLSLYLCLCVCVSVRGKLIIKESTCWYCIPHSNMRQQCLIFTKGRNVSSLNAISMSKKKRSCNCL